MNLCEIVEVRNLADADGFPCPRTASKQCFDCGSHLCDEHAETCGICHAIFCPSCTDRHLWADSYERDLGDVLALQDEVARAIAREIQAKLTPQEQNLLAGPRRVDPQAYQDYVKGRYHLNKRDAKDIQNAVEYFQQSIGKEPDNAAAYAGLADSYNFLANVTSVAPATLIPKARAAAKKALELDDALAEPHISLALIKVSYDRDWAGAASEFKRALELNPGYAQPTTFTVILNPTGGLRGGYPRD